MTLTPAHLALIGTALTVILGGGGVFLIRSQKRLLTADAASKISEAAVRLTARQGEINDGLDAEMKDLRGQLTELRVKQAATDGYLMADAVWHTQVIALLTAHGLSSPPQPQPPPGPRRPSEGS